MKKLAILVFGAFALSTTVQAATFDFTAEGNRDEQGYLTFISGVTNGNPMDAGLTVTAEDTAGNALYAYMDANSGGPGGLGVCNAVMAPNDTCNPSSDDNQMGVNEIINMTSVDSILGLTIIGDHSPVVAGGTLHYVGDDAIERTIDISGANLTYFALAIETHALKYWIEGGEMYVSAVSTVPVPAALWLFGSAVFGFFGLRRKLGMDAVAA